MVEGVGPVVVGTDFSDTAAVALAEARRLGALMGARVEVVHVVDGPQDGWGHGGRADEWLRRTGLQADELVVRFGSPWVELVRYAAELDPALVVVGSHGLSGYQPLSLGATASRVTVHARYPVVLVSPRVAQATDGAAGATGAARAAGTLESRNMASRDGVVAMTRPGPG